jgi:hypothetical protein
LFVVDVPVAAVGEEGPVGAPHQQALPNVTGQVHHRPCQLYSTYLTTNSKKNVYCIYLFK